MSSSDRALAWKRDCEGFAFLNKAKLKLSRRFTLFFFLTFLIFLFSYFPLSFLPPCPPFSFLFSTLPLFFPFFTKSIKSEQWNSIAFALSWCVGIRKTEMPYLIRRLSAQEKWDPNKRTGSRIPGAIREPFIITEMRRAASLGMVLLHQPGWW